MCGTSCTVDLLRLDQDAGLQPPQLAPWEFRELRRAVGPHWAYLVRLHRIMGALLTACRSTEDPERRDH